MSAIVVIAVIVLVVLTTMLGLSLEVVRQEIKEKEWIEMCLSLFTMGMFTSIGFLIVNEIRKVI
jgi:hypothetical protein